MAVNIPFPLPATGYALNSKVRVNLDFLVAQFNEFNSGTATWDQVSVGTANSLTGAITLYNASNANYVTIRPGVTSSSHTYTLPLALPSSEGLLKCDSAGTMAWSASTSSILYTNSGGVLTWLARSNGVLTETSGTLSFTASPTFTTLTSTSFLFGAGTAAIPSIRASDNTDTGLYYLVSGAVLALSHEGTRFFGKESGGVFLEGIPNYTGSSLIFSEGGYLKELPNAQGTTGLVSVASGQTPKVIKLLGTTNQVSVTFATNDVTLALPQSIDTSANFQVGSVRTGAGLVSACAVRLNAANTGLYMNASNIIGFAINGATYASLDDTGAFFATGEVRGALIRTTGSMKFSNGGSIVTIQALGTAFGDYTLTLPPDDGTSGYVLRTDGAGVLTWVSVASAGGATTALDNLASVAINTTLVSDTNNTDDLGTSAIKWRTGYFGTSLDVTTAGVAGLQVNTSSPQTTFGGVDISSGGIGLVVGAQSGAITRNNNTSKISRIGCPHYINAEEPVAMLVGSMDGTDHIVSVGGGTGFLNASTVVRFMTAANTTTTSGTERARFDPNGNLVIGLAALATNATDGFLYIPSCAGAPTGVPTAYTGRVPMVFDTTNNKFWIYDGGWIGIVLA